MLMTLLGQNKILHQLRSRDCLLADGPLALSIRSHQLELEMEKSILWGFLAHSRFDLDLLPAQRTSSLDTVNV